MHLVTGRRPQHHGGRTPNIRNATTEEARRLELPANRSVLKIIQTFRVAATDVDEDIAVATVDIVFAADRYELRYVMEIK